MKYKFLLFAIVLFLTNQKGVSQDTTSVKSSKDSTTPSLTLAAIYGNNADYYGLAADERLPYFFTNASYRLPGGVFFSAGAYRLLNNSESLLSEVDLTAGYEMNFAENFNGSLAYTRSFFGKNSPLLQAANENTLSASISYDWKVLKSGLNSYYSFGTSNDMFLTFTTSKLIELGSLFNNKDYISFEPGFEIASGTVRYLEEYIIRRGNQGQANGVNRGPSFTTQTRSASTFDILSYNANVLLGYNRSSYLVEAGYQLSFLGSDILATSRKPRSFFNLSLYYQF